MNATVISLIAALDAAQKVETNKTLSTSQKHSILSDIMAGLTPEQLCGGCIATRKVVAAVISDVILKCQPEEKPVAKSSKKTTAKKSGKKSQ